MRTNEENASIIDRTVDIIDAISDMGNTWFTQSEMSRKVGLAPNTTGRYLNRLVAKGWLDREGDSGRYRLSRRILRKQVEQGLKFIRASEKTR